MVSFKRRCLDSCVYPVLTALKVPKLLQWLMDTHQARYCLSRVAAAEGVRFSPSAIVRNPIGDNDRIRLGRHTLVEGELAVCEYGGRIEIGEHSYVGRGAHVWSGESVKIGSYVLLAHNVNVTDTNTHQLSALERAEHFLRTDVHGQPFLKGSIKTGPVEISDHAWLNFGVAVLRGVNIGEGAIIGACSVVTKHVPPYTLAVGNPARVVREIPRDIDLAGRLRIAEEAGARAGLSR